MKRNPHNHHYLLMCHGLHTKVVGSNPMSVRDSVWGLHALFVHAWILPQPSDFILQTESTPGRLSCDCELLLGMTVSVSGCLSLYVAL